MNYLIIAQIVQIVVALILVALVLIQGKGTGLSSAFSGSFGMYRSKRGVERLIFAVTILCGILLVLNSLFIILVG